MNGYCVEPAKNDDTLRIRAEQFVTDRSVQMLAGARRMGRPALIDLVTGIFSDNDLSWSVYPNMSGKDAIVFADCNDVIKLDPGLDAIVA